MKKTRCSVKKPREPVTVEMPPHNWQPSVNELREEFDMPGPRLDQLG